MMRWTKEQMAAIETRGSMIVSAAAGAGKTAVLTERLCRLVESGTGVDKLLVLTFTRAAAAEMKNRIAKRLRSLSNEAADAESARYLRAEAHAVTGASISTIHAFCMRVVRRHSHELALSPKLRVAGEMESAALREQAREELLDRFGEEDNADWHALLAAFGDEKRAFEAVLAAYEFILAQPAPFAWLEDAIEKSRAGEPLLEESVTCCKEEMQRCIHELQAAADAAPLDWESVRAVIDDDLSHARALLITDGYEDYRAMLCGITFETLRFPRGTDESDKTAFKAPRESYKELIRAQRQRLWRETDEEIACLSGAAEVLGALLAVLRAYDAVFTEKKRAHTLVDYNDLERLTLRALAIPAVAAEYRQRFDYVAVDEYQDSNRVQEAILACVSRPDNLFLVGDVKQSIYRFRQAEPSLFLEKLDAAAGGALCRVDLLHNFRSSQAVIDSVNDVFSAVMSREAGALDYDERARLLPGGSAPVGGAELHIIDKAGADDEEDAHDAIVEARFVASRIRALREEDPALRYADIAILLQYSTHAMRFAAELAREGVPCYAQTSGGYFDALEVQIFLSLLRVIDNRRRDVPLLSALRAPFGGFDESELAHIRTAHPAGSFYEAAIACAATDDALGAKLSAFFSRLEGWRADARLLPMEQFIGKIFDETGFYEEMGVLAGGKTRQANLDALLIKARDFEATGARGLYAFLQHIEPAGRSASIGAAQTAAADVVRILTIHRSKGLEFPVVFVCQLGARFVLTADKNPLVLHGVYGAGVKYIDAAAHVRRDSAYRQTLLKRIRLEELAEEMRVLYVAMTRAKDQLILCGCMRGAEETLDAPLEKPLPAAILRGSSPLSWILMGRGEALDVTLHARGEWLVGLDDAPLPAMPEEDARISAAIRARFAWRYPHIDAIDLPAKASVTQLEREALPVFEQPRFITGDVPTALSIGTAMHTAMQRLPAHPLTIEEARALIDSLAARRLIGKNEAGLLKADTLCWFSHTPLYARLLQSPRCERELPFIYAADAAALFHAGCAERVLLQGVIDACFLEDGAWVILDYKTDAPCEDDTEASLIRRHENQTALYAVALAALTHQPVRECAVVYLSMRKIVTVPLSDSK